MTIYNITEINDHLKGKEILLSEITDDFIRLSFDDGYLDMYHSQDCCETVYIEDINGNKDLNGAIFYEVIQKECDRDGLDCDDSFTWTFYTIITSKGYLDIRWYGSSNGYYSESVDVEFLFDNEDLM